MKLFITTLAWIFGIWSLFMLLVSIYFKIPYDPAASLRMLQYILEGHNPVPEPNLARWWQWFETADRVVRQETFDGVTVSTVFLSFDDNHRPSGKPLLFETKVFGGNYDQDQERCSTWAEAEEMHEAMKAKVKVVAK